MPSKMWCRARSDLAMMQSVMACHGLLWVRMESTSQYPAPETLRSQSQEQSFRLYCVFGHDEWKFNSIYWARFLGSWLQDSPPLELSVPFRLGVSQQQMPTLPCQQVLSLEVRDSSLAQCQSPVAQSSRDKLLGNSFASEVCASLC